MPRRRGRLCLKDLRRWDPTECRVQFEVPWPQHVEIKPLRTQSQELWGLVEPVGGGPVDGVDPAKGPKGGMMATTSLTIAFKDVLFREVTCSVDRREAQR